jgi:seryl-tRNA synthetase
MSQEDTSEEFYAGLLAHGLILPVGVQGAFGRASVFEEVLYRFETLINETTKNDGADLVRFPPIMNRKVLEKTGYLESFPHLAGTVFSFTGNDAAHKDLVARVAEGQAWADTQSMTDVVLTPAACYPVYPTLTGTLPVNGRLFDTQNWVFRHEPSHEPTRLQSFRMREFIRVGAPEVVVEWRNMWLERGLAMLRGLGINAGSDTASDPFFGRGGRMLAVNQREQKLKFEILVPVISESKPTAVCSFNYHQDHFGGTWQIHMPDGSIAHSACMGFGMERIVMALFKTHGFDPDRWPSEVRRQLWP